MILELKQVTPLYFRWHSSGDFYSEEYIEKVKEIVKSAPNTLFRTTTRRRDLAKSIRKIAALSNMIVRESLDTEVMEPSMGLSVAAISSLEVANGMFKCLNDCEICEHHCWHSECDVCFDEH